MAFTAAGIWAVYTFWYREKYLPRVTDANPARIVGSTLTARGWRVLPGPLRKECYGLIAQDDGSVTVSVRTGEAQRAPSGTCPLSTATAAASIALR